MAGEKIQKIIQLLIQADAGSANSVLDSFSAKIRETAAANGQSVRVDADTSAATTGITRLQTGFAQVTAGVMAAQMAIGILKGAYNELSAAAEKYIAVNSKMEQWRLQFKVMTGDAREAQKIMAETKQFADRTPFKTGDVMSARQQLLSAGIKDMESMQNVADLAAGSGRTLTEAAAAFARLQSGATGEAMEALRLMNISREKFEAVGINFTSSGEALATSAELMAALNKVVSAQYGGLSKESARQWEGLSSTLASKISDIDRQLSSGLFGSVKAVLKEITDAFTKLAESGLMERIGSAIGGIFGPMVTTLWRLLQALSPLAPILAGPLLAGAAALGIAFSALGWAVSQAASAVQFFLEMPTLGPAQAAANLKQRTAEINAQFKQQGILAIEAAGKTKAALESESDAATKAGKAQTQATIDAIRARKQAIADIERINQVQASGWAIDKARGRDSVQIAQEQAQQAAVDLATLQQKEDAVRKSQEASGVQYRKSEALLQAEQKAAATLANYYDTLIAKKEAMGEFATRTARLLAEADAIDKRGGDSGVKKYEALKTAAEEYLSDLQKMRESQAATAAGVATTQAASDALASGNLAQYENATAAISAAEKLFNLQALNERLGQIQQLREATNLGARERFALYEQERQVFAQFSRGVGEAIGSSMQQIQQLQQKAISAANSAIGILEKTGAGYADYRELASMISDLNINKSTASLSTLSSLASLSESLTKKGVNNWFMPSSGDVIGALRRELSGVTDSISSLRDGLSTLSGLAANVGVIAAKNFFDPWVTRLEDLKAQFGSIANISLAPVGQVAPPVQIPGANVATKGITSLSVPVTANINVTGFTKGDVENVISQTQTAIARELRVGFEEVNSRLGI